MCDHAVVVPEDGDGHTAREFSRGRKVVGMLTSRTSHASADDRKIVVILGHVFVVSAIKIDLNRRPMQLSFVH